MLRRAHKRTILIVAFGAGLLCLTAYAARTAPKSAEPEPEAEPGVVRCANLTYGANKTSKCFSDKFLEQAAKDTNIRTHRRFIPAKLDSRDLYQYPFAIMTGEGKFKLTDPQRRNMQRYLSRGGFIVASAGCSSPQWNKSFRSEIKQVFPDLTLKRLQATHPVFHSVYDITTSKHKRGRSRLPHLEGLKLDGRLVLVYSPEGLNDTGNAGKNCCCCGGNEVKDAKRLNVNLLAYALTH